MLFRKEIGESITLKFAEAVNKRRQNNLPIISLGLGEPEFKTPNEIIDQTIEALKKKNSGYSSPLGLFPLRKHIAEKLYHDNNISCEADNIIITAGAKQAFQLIANVVVEPNDEVIVINPSFVSFIPQLLISDYNCKVITVDMDKGDFGFPIKSIREQVTSKTKMVIINSPNNPGGYVIEEEMLQKLYLMACELDFIVLSDEIYEKINFGKTSHVSIGSFEKFPDRVITINGYSKSHAMTGWRLGYACFPKRYMFNLLKLQQHTNTNTCTFIQEGVLNAGNIDTEYLENYNQKLKTRIGWYAEMLKRVDRLSGNIPNGGFFAFMNISELNMDSNTFCGRLMDETGVATTPGIAFGKNWDDHVRISFATEDHLVKEGLALIEKFVNEL